MPRTKSRWRRILILIGILAILCGLVAVSLPLWFPWLARPAARAMGVEYENFRRLSLSRFELSKVTGTFTNVEFSADRVEAFLPHSWLWNRWIHDAQTNVFTLAEQWSLRINPTTDPDPDTPRKQSTLEVLDEIDQFLPILRDWLPAAQLRNGTVHYRDWSAQVPEVNWSSGHLNANLKVPESPHPISIHLDVTRSKHWLAELNGGWPGLAIHTEWTRQANAWDLKSSLVALSNRVDASARFTPSGWLPAQAAISANQLRIPPELHRVPNYDPIHGQFDLRWLNDQFTLALDAQAQPSSGANALWTALDLELRAHGDLQSATVDQLAARAPWINLNLREPVAIDYASLADAGPGVFDLSAELDHLHPDLQGLLQAEIEVQPGTNTFPTAALRAWTTNLSARGTPATRLEAQANFHWPMLELVRAQVDLGTNTTAQASATLDLQTRMLQSALVECQAVDLRQFLPPPFGVQGLRARIQAAGPLADLSHEGELQVDTLTLPQLNPLGLLLRWQGAGITSATCDAQIRAGDSRLLLIGQLQHLASPTARLDLHLDTLTLERDGQPVYTLSRPAQLRWQSTESSGPNFELDALAWNGADDRLLELSGGVQWPIQGQLALNTQQLLVSDARDFVPATDIPLTIDALTLTASWTNAPVDWDLASRVQINIPNQGSLVIEARAQGDDSGTSLESLTVGGWEAPPLVGHGQLPLLIDMTAAEPVKLLPDAPIDLTISHDAVDSMVQNLGALGRLDLSQPSFNLRLTGTARQPRGEVRASLAAAHLRSSDVATQTPRFERARLEADLRPDRIQLRLLEFDLDGQRVTVQGDWPINTNTWANILSGEVTPDLQQASARVLIKEADLAPIALRFPTLLAAQGKLHLDLRIQPGLALDGFLSLTNAVTRPLGPLAPLRDIEALIAFSGRTARVDRFTANLGGRPIHASGHATLTDNRQLLYTLRLQGTNAPLVREPGLLMRADIDLMLQNNAGQNPAITGAIRLRDGLMLQDVSSLLVDRLERPALRPPYFSVTNLPFARWPLDVKVTGEEFLRIRSPAFVGSVTAEAAVTGFLGKPVIQADVRIPRGRVLFPFGKLDVERAFATLGEEQPRGPLIDVVAAGQNYGYNVRLEVTGTLDNLNVLFTSTPPLSSEDILLMLTAGELPNQEITYSAEARAGRLITYLGREVATRFFGNEMGEERLLINSGENIARSGRTTYSIEYRLTPRWSLVGEYDEFNALNAGLKLRLYSR